MDWEQIGYTLGHGGVMGYAQILDERNKNKARDMLAALSDPTAADRKEAMKRAEARFGGGFIGQNPHLRLLQEKRDWMQADNDARYLLDNGYAEDSPEVLGFREIQEKAHAKADRLRSIGKSAGMDLSEVGAGMSLAELKEAVTRGIAPKLYQQYPQMQEQMAARNAWAGQTARDILGDQIAQGVQRVGVAPVAAPQPVTGAAPMTPPAAQLGGYAPQGTNLTDFDPNAGFGIPGMANPTQPDQNNSLGRAITGADMYKFLQDQGLIAKEKTFAEEVEEIARDYARQRAARMDDREIRKYLKEKGVSTRIANLVMAEHKQQTKEMMKQKALAQAAAASSSDQMAALIAAAAADPNMKISDLPGLINATNPDMRLDTINLGGTKVAMTRDTKGRVAGGAQVLPVTLSPKETANLQLDHATLNYRAQNDAANRAAANYRTWLSAYLRGGGDEKLSAADAKVSAQLTNQFNTVMEFYKMNSEVSREEMGDAVDAFYQNVMDGIKDGTIKPDDATDMMNQALFAQLLYATKFGEKEEAIRAWGAMDDDWQQSTDNPNYNVLNNIYQWLSGQDAGEKAHVQNKLPERKKPLVISDPEYPDKLYNWLPPSSGG